MTRGVKILPGGKELTSMACTDSEIFVRGGASFSPKFDSFLSEPSLARQRNSIFNEVLLACCWWPNIECWLGSFVIFWGSWPVLPRNPIFLWFFRRGPDLLSSPLDPRMHCSFCFQTCSHQTDMDMPIPVTMLPWEDLLRYCNGLIM